MQEKTYNIQLSMISLSNKTVEEKVAVEAPVLTIEDKNQVIVEATMGEDSIKQSLMITPPCVIIYSKSNSSFRMIPIALEGDETFFDFLTE